MKIGYFEQRQIVIGNIRHLCKVIHRRQIPASYLQELSLKELRRIQSTLESYIN
jgi:hypothetical protein